MISVPKLGEPLHSRISHKYAVVVEICNSLYVICPLALRGVRLTEAGTAFDDHLRIAIASWPVEAIVDAIAELEAELDPLATSIEEGEDREEMREQDDREAEASEDDEGRGRCRRATSARPCPPSRSCR